MNVKPYLAMLLRQFLEGWNKLQFSEQVVKLLEKEKKQMTTGIN